MEDKKLSGNINKKNNASGSAKLSGVPEKNLQANLANTSAEKKQKSLKAQSDTAVKTTSAQKITTEKTAATVKTQNVKKVAAPQNSAALMPQLTKAAPPKAAAKTTAAKNASKMQKTTKLNANTADTIKTAKTVQVNNKPQAETASENNFAQSNSTLVQVETSKPQTEQFLQPTDMQAVNAQPASVQAMQPQQSENETNSAIMRENSSTESSSTESTMQAQNTAQNQQQGEPIIQVPVVKKYVDLGESRNLNSANAKSSKSEPTQEVYNIKGKKKFTQRFSFKIASFFGFIAIALIAILIVTRVLSAPPSRPDGFIFSVGDVEANELYVADKNPFSVKIDYLGKYSGSDEITLSIDIPIATFNNNQRSVTVKKGDYVRINPVVINGEVYGGTFFLKAKIGDKLGSLEVLIDKPVAQLTAPRLDAEGIFYVGQKAQLTTNIIPQGGVSEISASTLKRDIVWEVISGGDKISINSSTGEVTALASGIARVRARTKINYLDLGPNISSAFIDIAAYDVPPDSATFVWNKTPRNLFIGEPGATRTSEKSNAIIIKASEIVSHVGSLTGFDATYIINTNKFYLQERVTSGTEKLYIEPYMVGKEQYFAIYARQNAMDSLYQDIIIDVYLDGDPLDSPRYGGTVDNNILVFTPQRVTNVALSRKQTQTAAQLEYFYLNGTKYYTKIDLIDFYLGSGQFEIKNNDTNNLGHNYSTLDIYFDNESQITYEIVGNRKAAYFTPSEIGTTNLMLQLRNGANVLSEFSFEIEVNPIGFEIEIEQTRTMDLILSSGITNKNNEAISFIKTIKTTSSFASSVWTDPTIVGKIVFDKSLNTNYLTSPTPEGLIKFEYKEDIAGDTSGSKVDNIVSILGTTELSPKSLGQTYINISFWHNFGSDKYTNMTPNNFISGSSNVLYFSIIITVKETP